MEGCIGAPLLHSSYSKSKIKFGLVPRYENSILRRRKKKRQGMERVKNTRLGMLRNVKAGKNVGR